MSKKTLLLISSLLTFSLILITLVTSQKKQPPTPTIPSYSPPPTLSVTPDLEATRAGQEQYASDRQNILSQKPWVTKLPIQNSQYFIFYNEVSDQIVVKLYSLEAKQQALDTLNNLGVDLNKQAVSYIDKSK